MNDQMLDNHFSKTHPNKILRPLVLRGVLIGFCALQLNGCPGGEPARKLKASCQKIGTRCQLKTGVLGVCSPAGDGVGLHSQLICTPQH